MPELNPYLAAVLGLILLFVGGEALVRGAVALARRIGMSPLLVGLTVVGVATSSPELVVSVEAAIADQPDIALGNIVGSNIANLLLILGLGALIHPLATQRSVVFRDGGVMLAAALVLTGVALTGIIGPLAGGLMMAAMVAYMVFAYFCERRQKRATVHAKEAEEFEDIPMTTWLAVAAIVGGILALVGGAQWLIDGAVSIATVAGVPEAVIGLTLVAVGTSLPEMATTLVAALRRHTDVAVGNVLGSNIFNIFGILGVTALVTPITVNPHIMAVDIWVMLAVTAVALPLLASGGRLSRPEGAGFAAVYAGYVTWLFLGPGTAAAG